MKPRPSSTVVGFSLFCLLVIPQARAQFVEISAQIDLNCHLSRDTNDQATTKPITISAVCVTGGNKWSIQEDYSLNSLYKWFFDGTNLHKSTQVIRLLPRSGKDAFGALGDPFETGNTNIAVDSWPCRDGHPLGDEGVNLPWLAFCSGKYLMRPNRLIPLPCALLRHTPDRYSYSDQTQTFQDAAGLPRSIDLFLSKSLYLASADDFYKDWENGSGSRCREAMRCAVTNLQEGMLSFHYSVLATTNFQGQTFPLQFEFSQEPRKFVLNGDKFWRGFGKLTSIRETTEPKDNFDGQ